VRCPRREQENGVGGESRARLCGSPLHALVVLFHLRHASLKSALTGIWILSSVRPVRQADRQVSTGETSVCVCGRPNTSDALRRDETYSDAGFLLAVFCEALEKLIGGLAAH